VEGVEGAWRRRECRESSAERPAHSPVRKLEEEREGGREDEEEERVAGEGEREGGREDELRCRFSIPPKSSLPLHSIVPSLPPSLSPSLA